MSGGKSARGPGLPPGMKAKQTIEEVKATLRAKGHSPDLWPDYLIGKGNIDAAIEAGKTTGPYALLPASHKAYEQLSGRGLIFAKRKAAPPFFIYQGNQGYHLSYDPEKAPANGTYQLGFIPVIPIHRPLKNTKLSLDGKRHKVIGEPGDLYIAINPRKAGKLTLTRSSIPGIKLTLIANPGAARYH